MRKLKLQVQMTVDGYISGPNGELDWMTLPWTEDINKYVQEIIDPVDCIILGRKLAKVFIPYWATVAANPDNPEFTSLAKGDLVDEITQSKKQDGKDIYACGGATFVSALIKHGLIDEFQLFINPTAIGNGMTIFNELDSKQNLTLVKSTSFDCGIVVLNYKPKHD